MALESVNLEKKFAQSRKTFKITNFKKDEVKNMKNMLKQCIDDDTRKKCLSSEMSVVSSS